MAKRLNFEDTWECKLADAVDRVLSPDSVPEVLAGVEALADHVDPATVIDWTNEVVGRVCERSTPEQCVDIFSSCACQYPVEDLAEARELFARSGDVDAVIELLRDKCIHFLRTVVKLDDHSIDDLIEFGWGLAGVREGHRIYATKLPKSGSLKEYLAEPDAVRRRALYCHCPRVRLAPLLGQEVPQAYCACGAGFYKGIWEAILQQPVRIEVLETVLTGSECCVVAIDLPEGCVDLG